MGQFLELSSEGDVIQYINQWKYEALQIHWRNSVPLSELI